MMEVLRRMVLTRVVAWIICEKWSGKMKKYGGKEKEENTSDDITVRLKTQAMISLLNSLK